tara:strand:- start:535 stop:1173 length:639 start_codon:yes stop_codon:yes gene_type:complete
MLRKVKLYGKLAKFVGHRVLEADVNNAAETVRFLLANWPELEKHMADQYYKVSTESWEIGEDEVAYPLGASDISIIPVVGGAGRGSGKILLGIALIGASFLLPGAGMFGTQALGATGSAGLAATGWTAAGIGTTIGTIMSGVGASLVLYGVADALTPIPGVPESTQDPKNSFSFSGTQNTSTAGVPVPICYGQVLTGSVVISAAVDTHQVET